MAKPPKDTMSVLPTGRWSWDDKTQSLECNCVSTSVEVKEKRKKTRSVYHALASNCPDRLLQRMSSGRGGRHGARKSVGRANLDAYRASIKRQQCDNVTIEDVKLAALQLLRDHETLAVPICFLSVIRTQELDAFLAALLLYLSCHFERKALDKNPKPVMAEQSMTERQLMAEMSAKVELAQKQLAYCYSSLVLGQGLSQQHHMACGRSRVSSTYSDRQLYECLYSFFCYVAWVTFGRRDLKGIQTEVGRLLRSDAFNPALRTRTEDQAEEEAQKMPGTEDQCESKETSHRTTDHRCKRRSQRHPPLSRMLTLRSPVMVSLLPTPREQAPHLFSSRSPQPPPAQHCDTQALMEELSQQLAAVSFGILGKPLSQFSCTTLTPQGARSAGGEEDDEDDEDDEGGEERAHLRSSKTSVTVQRSMTATDDKHPSASRANTVASRATTEGVASDTE